MDAEGHVWQIRECQLYFLWLEMTQSSVCICYVTEHPDSLWGTCHCQSSMLSLFWVVIPSRLARCVTEPKKKGRAWSSYQTVWVTYVVKGKAKYDCFKALNMLMTDRPRVRMVRGSKFGRIWELISTQQSGGEYRSVGGSGWNTPVTKEVSSLLPDTTIQLLS